MLGFGITMIFKSVCDYSSHMKRANISLYALRAFEATARLNRQNAAAQELGVTHGAVSRQIRQLEDSLGVSLFEGTRNAPFLTVSGQKLATGLTSAFDQIDAAIRSLRDDEAGIVDVSCLSTFAMRWLIPRLNRFYQSYPEIDIRISTNEHSTRFQDGRYDVVIDVLDANMTQNAHDILLFNEKLCVVVAPSLLAACNLKSVADVAALPRLVSKTRLNAWPLFLEAMGCAPLPPPAIQAFDHYSYAIEAAAAGLGACVVPHHLVGDALAEGRLVKLFDDFDSPYRYVARQFDRHSKCAGFFCAWLKDEVARPF
jgi:LysR family transcriptional regulator, glycine cleavage system transcriptional activator